MKWHGWSWKQPAWRAIEREDTAVQLWQKEVWPQGRAPRRRPAAGSSLLLLKPVTSLAVVPTWHSRDGSSSTLGPHLGECGPSGAWSASVTAAGPPAR
ncbi:MULTISPECIES: hypothetical protein [unclassified Streptomyces]|uniref:hypothetical protein n=1 Tax=unclassified Streptomyces TaxID=2593676 RepID=UPI0021B128EF|nr:hypothetical protein [Streptomyces sp. BHT-5-2]